MTKEEATHRNWTKMNLTGLHFYKNNKAKLTLEEQIKINQILEIRDSLILKWDKNTELFIEPKNIKKYKCWCGKKTNVLRKDEKGEIVCKEHESKYK